MPRRDNGQRKISNKSSLKPKEFFVKGILLSSVQVVASFLLAFKSVLIEGTEITILSLATINLIGKRNVLLGLFAGLAGTFLSYLLVSRIFLYVAGQKSILGLTNGGEGYPSERNVGLFGLQKHLPCRNYLNCWKDPRLSKTYVL
ncbi:MAG: hypothetical protein ACHQ1H_09250 [Nitrososphaerales archaeon]